MKYTEWLLKKGYMSDKKQLIDYSVAEEYLNSKSLKHVRDSHEPKSKEEITRIVWDGILISHYQDENWGDQDTCRLIVKKLMEDLPIEHATGNLP